MQLTEVMSELRALAKKLKSRPDRFQRQMNNCLANIGIHHPDLRARALAIGESLEVLKEYPTPSNCTSPYAPIWINEMVSRQEQA